MAGVRPADRAGARCIGGRPVERCVARGTPGAEPGSEVLGMHRWSRSGSRPGWALSASAVARPPGPGRHRRASSVKVTPNQGLKTARPSPSAARPPQDLRRQAPDLVRHRVHRRRPGPDEPRHRHPPLRHHARQGPPGQPQRHLQLPLPPHDRDHRRRLLRHGRARHLRHRRRDRPGPGHRRAHHLQDARRRPHRPPARRRRTTTTADRRAATGSPRRSGARAATPGGCSR